MKIEVNNLQKSFEKGDLSVDVIKGVDFIIHSGETVAITGHQAAVKPRYCRSLVYSILPQAAQ